ncbi:hypothetical protein P3G55_01120 [Leptospira sp. 96542]|nr:hypothetical protein [Leptospira sp. 96542]
MKSIKRKTKSNQSPFVEPNIFLKNKEIPAPISLRVLSQILPFRFLVSSLGLSFVLFMIPISILLFVSSHLESTVYLLPMIIGSSLFFCFYCLVLGFLLLNTRIPFLSEWKEKLGFEEV